MITLAFLIIPDIIIIITFTGVLVINNIIIIIKRMIPGNAIEFLLLYNFYIIALTDTLLYKNTDRNNTIKTDIVPEL